MADDEDMGERLTTPLISEKGTPDFVSHRRCTDVLCTLLLVAMWVSMTLLGIYGVKHGDYRLLLYPLDYDGNICGMGVGAGDGALDMTDYPYLYYVNDFSGGVCVKECPKLDNLTDPYTLVTYDGLFQADGATVNESVIAVADYSASNSSLACTDLLCYPNGNPESSFASFGVNKGKGFAYYALDTYEVLWRCIFRDDAKVKLNAIISPHGDNFTADLIDEATQNELIKASYDVWENLMGDLWITRYFVLGFGFGAPLVLGFFYALLLRVPCVLRIMVWSSIFATIGIFFGGAWYAGHKAQQWKVADPPVHTASDIKAVNIASYVLYALGGVLVLLFLVLRKRIQLAIGCVKETSRAVTRMPLIILFPVLQGLGFLLFFVVWAAYGVNLASMGEFSTKTFAAGNLQITVRAFSFSDQMVGIGWYMLFCFFWSGQFIMAMGEIVFAMSVARWYFARNKSEIGNRTVLKSFVASFWYHSGTAAFGSLILAILNTIRAFIAYLQKKADEMNNSVAKAVLCCCQCCFWCLEKCIKFMNKNAYIQTAIFGSSFCISAKEAFFLILRNAARVGAITYVTGGVEFVGKMFIMSSTTALAYFAIDQYLVEEVHSVIGPLILIVIISWIIAGMFMSVYDMGIATILQCFVADEEMFSPDEMFAEGSLKSWVDKHG